MQETLNRGHAYPLHPTPEQENRLLQYTAACRDVWNWGLEKRIENRDTYLRRFPRLSGNMKTIRNMFLGIKPPNFFSQSRQLTQVRKEKEFLHLQSVPRDMLDRALKALDLAWPKMKKKGKHWKCKGKDESFTVRGQHIRIRKLNNRWGIIHLPKMKKGVKFRCDREIPVPADATLTEAAIRLTPFGWRVSIAWKAEREVETRDGEVGIDMGVAKPITLSDGQIFYMPKELARLEDLVKRAHRTISRRKKGSNRRKEAVRRLARLKAWQARLRREWQHRVTTKITGRYGRVVVEDLRVNNMTRSAKGTVEKPGKNVAAKSGLNRSILNVGWHNIATMLAYKAVDFQKVNPAHTSQTCSRCGAIDKESRESQAVFHCRSCGFRGNADVNAARVILRRGCASSLLGVEGSSISTPVKRQPRSVEEGLGLLKRRSKPSHSGRNKVRSAA